MESKNDEKKSAYLQKNILLKEYISRNNRILTNLRYSMPIEAIRGDIMDTAPLNSEAIAVWFYSGFNTRYLLWSSVIKERYPQLKLIYPDGLTNLPNHMEFAYGTNIQVAPWRLPSATLWKITNQNQDLRYIYIFPNPEDRKRLENLDDIDVLIRSCFATLTEFGINSVSLILIPALQSDEYRKDEIDLADRISALRMIHSIRNWLSEKDVDMNVYLVDRKGGFGNLT
jgi:hypothetical protein